MTDRVIIVVMLFKTNIYAGYFLSLCQLSNMCSEFLLKLTTCICENDGEYFRAKV